MDVRTATKLTLVHARARFRVHRAGRSEISERSEYNPVEARTGSRPKRIPRVDAGPARLAALQIGAVRLSAACIGVLLCALYCRVRIARHESLRRGLPSSGAFRRCPLRDHRGPITCAELGGGGRYVSKSFSGRVMYPRIRRSHDEREKEGDLPLARGEIYVDKHVSGSKYVYLCHTCKTDR